MPNIKAKLAEEETEVAAAETSHPVEERQVSLHEANLRARATDAALRNDVISVQRQAATAIGSAMSGIEARRRQARVRKNLIGGAVEAAGLAPSAQPPAAAATTGGAK